MSERIMIDPFDPADMDRLRTALRHLRPVPSGGAEFRDYTLERIARGSEVSGLAAMADHFYRAGGDTAAQVLMTSFNPVQLPARTVCVKWIGLRIGERITFTIERAPDDDAYWWRFDVYGIRKERGASEKFLNPVRLGWEKRGGYHPMVGRTGDPGVVFDVFPGIGGEHYETAHMATCALASLLLTQCSGTASNGAETPVQAAHSESDVPIGPLSMELGVTSDKLRRAIQTRKVKGHFDGFRWFVSAEDAARLRSENRKK